jgi:hypothetical protein
LTKPLDSLFRELRLSVGPIIDIPALFKQLDAYNQFIVLEKEILGNWKTAGHQKTYTLNNKPFTVENKGQEVMLFKTPDNITYLIPLKSFPWKEKKRDLRKSTK